MPTLLKRVGRRSTSGGIVCRLLSLALLGLAGRAAAQTVSPPVRVLVVFGVTPEAPAISQFTQRLRATLRNEVAAPVEFYEEYLDLDRFPGLSVHLVNYFAEKY